MTSETIRLAQEMAEHLQDLPGDKLCWLVLNNPQLTGMPEFSPESLLVTELMRRSWDSLSDVALVASFGFVMQDESVIDYRDILENENGKEVDAEGQIQ